MNSKQTPYREGKKAWARSLQKGDLVEDCRYQIVRIKEVQHDFGGIREGWPLMLAKFLRWLPLPLSIWYWLDCQITDRLPKGGYQDTMLVFEDGAHCSALACCDSLEKRKAKDVPLAKSLDTSGDWKPEED